MGVVQFLPVIMHRTWFWVLFSTDEVLLLLLLLFLFNQLTFQESLQIKPFPKANFEQTLRNISDNRQSGKDIKKHETSFLCKLVFIQ